MHPYHINTRFSYERRVKLIFMCCFLIFAAAVMFAATAYSEDYTEPPGRTNLLRTSDTEDNYSVIEAAGNKIEARGKYTDTKIRKMFIKGMEDASGSYSLNAQKDGTYDASLTVTPEPGAYILLLKTDSDMVMQYRVFYDGSGWYFPLNGLEKSNRDVFEHIYEAPSEAAALYLSPSADAAEINTALEQIKALTESVTEGIDDDYEKARAISRFVAGTIFYDEDARESNVDINTIALYNVLRSERTTCAGFANLFCAMAEAAGIDAVNIKGGVITDSMPYDTLVNGVQNHEFAAFYYEKGSRWVWVDPCWDGSGVYKNGEFNNIKTRPMFFDISDEAFAHSHRADKAERRSYFSAKTETAPIGGGDAEAGETAAETEAPEAAEETDTADTSVNDLTETDPNSIKNADGTVIYVIIAVLAAGVIAAAVILIKTIINGRKN